MGDENKGQKGPIVIPRAVINRLSRYHFYLTELMEKGIEKISSRELSKMMGITASQLRQDLSYFGEFGQRGYGYKVDELNAEIEEIMGLQKKHFMVVVGAGNLGQALAQYYGFRKKGFFIKALFDVNPKVIGLQVGDIPVLDIDDLAQFVRNENITIGVVAVPKGAAQSVANSLVEAGVKGIWNFAPIELKVPEKIVVENVNLLGSLLILSFLMNDEGNEVEL